MKHRTVALAIAAVLAAAAPASKAIVYVTTLSGANEVPPAASAGTGSARVVFDTSAQTMTVNISFAGLVGTSTVAHIHCCADTSSNAGVATTTPTFPGFPTGVNSGSYSQSFSLLADSTYSPGFLAGNGGTPEGAATALQAGIDDGLAYVNVHSSVFGGGELRGQLAPIPEPSTFALALLGLGVLGIAMRRRNPG